MSSSLPALLLIVLVIGNRVRDQRRGGYVVAAPAGRAAAPPTGPRAHRRRRRGVRDCGPRARRTAGHRGRGPAGRPRGLVDLRVLGAHVAPNRPQRTGTAHRSHGERSTARGVRRRPMGLPGLRLVSARPLDSCLVCWPRGRRGRARPLRSPHARPHGFPVRHDRRGRWSRCRPRRDRHHLGGSTPRHWTHHHRLPPHHDARRDRHGARRAGDGDGRDGCRHRGRAESLRSGDGDEQLPRDELPQTGHARRVAGANQHHSEIAPCWPHADVR